MKRGQRWRASRRAGLAAAALLVLATAAYVVYPPGGVTVVTGSLGPAGSASVPANCIPSVLHAAPVPETLTATVVPAGFGLFPGPDMFSPPNALMYVQGRFQATLLISRTFTTAPAQQDLARASATTTATVGGSPAILATGGSLGLMAHSGPSVAIAWKPNPNVTLEVAGQGLAEATVESVADGVVSMGGFYPVKACARGKPTVVGPISQAAAFAKAPGAIAAKLAQTAEYYAQTGEDSYANPLCLQVCDPSVVVWVVVSNNHCPRALGLSESPAPSPTPEPTGPCWSTTVLNASTGVALPGGIAEGQGSLPSWWGAMTDYTAR